MLFHAQMTTPEVDRLIASGEIQLSGHKRLKIYCKLNCGSAKRTLTTNRVFFRDEEEALAQGFRPCGNCMRPAYLDWKGADK